MKSYLKFFICIAVVVFLLLVVSGCKTTASAETTVAETTAAETTAANLKPVTLGLWQWQTMDNYVAAFNDIFTLYKKDHPNVTFDMKTVVPDQYMPMLKTAITGKTLPQIFEVWTGAQIKDFYTSLVDLTDILKQDKDWWDWIGDNASSLDVQYNGKIYLLPIDMWYCGIYVNTKILDKYGLQEPKTIDDMINMVKVLEPDGIKPLASGLKNMIWQQFMWISMVHQIEPEGTDMENQAEKGEISWNNPEFITACEALKKMWDSGVWRPDAFTRDYNIEGLQEYLDQKALTLYGGGDWYCGTVYDKGVETVVNPWPLVEENGRSNFLKSNGLALATYPDNPDMDETLKFMKFLSSPEVTKIWVSYDIHPAAKIPEGVTFKNPVLNQLIATATQFPSVNPWIYDSQLYNGFTQGLNNYMLGQIKVEDFLNSLDKIVAQEK